MAVIEITEKNKHLYQGKCVVLQSHIHDKKEVKPGEVVTKIGMDYFEALKCKLVRLYDPALDEDDPTQEVKSKKQEVTINDDTFNGLPLASSDKEKKLGPKRKKKTS